MNKLMAIEKITYSLNMEEPQIITPKGQVYEEHVDKLSKLLIERIINPVRVNVTSTCADERSFTKFQKAVVWGIAKDKDIWLLILEAENEFALGFGSDPNNIKMHGFSSSDALGEWCV